MSTDLVRYGGPSAAVTAASLPERLEYATALAQAGLLPADYRRNPANVLLAIEKGEALGIHHMMAIESIHVINGRTSQSAELMKALILRAGHMFDVVEQTPEKAVVECARRERPEKVFRHEWTIEEARTAELLSSGTWKKYPKAMLAARVTSEAARAHFSDVLAGMVYTPEELGADIDGNGRIVDVTGTATVADHRTGEVRQNGASEPGTDTRDDTRYASDGQLRQLGVLFSRHGVTDRDERLALAAAIVDRPLSTSKQLSVHEASGVIARLANVEDFAALRAELLGIPEADEDADKGSAAEPESAEATA